MGPRHGLASLVAAALLSSACSYELEVPPDIRLTCADGFCPAGFTCVTTVEPPACVASAQLGQAPDVATSAVSPATAREDVQVRVTFTVTKALGRDPAVSLALTPPRVLVKDAGASSGNTYVYVYDPVGDEPQAQDLLLRADLQDVQGQVATGRTVGQVRFDFSTPALATVALTGSPARSAGQLRVTFTASEPLSADPVVRVGGVPMAKDAAGSGGLSYAYTYVSSGTESEEPAGLPVTVDLVDAGGNTATGIVAASAVFDRTPPALEEPAVVSPAPPAAAGLGTLVRASFTASEPLGADPVVTLGTIEMDKGVQAGRSYTFSHVTAAGDGEGTRALAFALEDLAGNTASVAGPDVTVDFGAPAVTAVALCQPDGTGAPCAATESTFSAQPGHDVAKLTFSLSEPAVVEVTVGTEVLAPGACTTDGLQRSCTFAVTDPAGGTQPRVETAGVYVQATDAAGNRALANTFLTRDFDPPGLAGTPVLERCDAYAPARLGPGDLWTRARSAYGCTFQGQTVSGPVKVTFTIDEPVLAPPAVGVDGLAAAFLVDDALAPPQFAAYLDVTPADGARQVSARVQDRTGNEAVLELGTLRVDTAAPPAVDTQTGGAVVYQRRPWGDDTTGGAKAFHLRGAAGAAAPGFQVVAWDGGDLQTAAPIGRTTADAAGAFGGASPFSITSGDLAEVFVVQEDLAGNPSPPALVWDGEWIATTGFKQAGSTDANPNVFALDPAWRRSRYALTQTEPPAAASLGRRNRGQVATAGAPDLVDATPTAAAPSARAGCAMAHDADTGRTVLFGGFATFQQGFGSATVPYGDTWSWDGRRWQQLVAPSGPPTDTAPALVHDPVRSRVVLVTSGGETWELEDETWRRVCWPGCTPGTQCTCTASPTATHAAIWDPVRAAVVVGGGQWSWDGRDWTQLAASPSIGLGTVHVASRDDGGAPLALTGVGTSAWNGTAWAQVGPMPPSGGNGARFGEWALWWDVRTGAYLALEVRNNALHAWNGSAWVALPAPSGAAATVQHACGASDLENGGFFRFGGCEGIGPGICDPTDVPVTGKFFRLDADAVRRYAPGATPSPRSGHAMTDVRNEGRAWLFDGLGPTSRYPLMDEWAWDGVAWTEIPTTASMPDSGLIHGALAYLGPSRLVQLGGIIQGTGASYPTPGSVTSRTRLTADPAWSIFSSGDPFDYVEPTGSGADDPAMAWDVARSEVLYFRGTEGGVATYTGQWVANNPGWTGPGLLWAPRASAQLPATTSGHRLAHCAAAGGTVLYGGDVNETWIWSGTAWSQVAPPTSPPLRRSHALYCDERRGKVLLFGGDVRDDVWEFDGVTWRELFPVLSPSARTFGSGAFLSARGEGVLFGGNAGSDALALGDTWAVDGGSDRRPAQLFHASFAAAGTGPVSLRSVAATWDATASTSSTPQGPSSLARLWLRDGSGWSPVASSGAVPSMTWSTESDPAWSTLDPTTRATRLRRLLGGNRLDVSLAASPLGTNGTIPGYATITTSYLEAKVSYRLACLAAGAGTSTPLRCCSGVASGTTCQ